MKLKNFLKNVKTKTWCKFSVLTTALTSIMWYPALGFCEGNTGSKTVEASALSDTQVNTALNRMTAYGQGFVLALLGLVLLFFVGYPFMTGGDEGSQKAKKNLKHIMVGFVICELALNIALTFANFWAMS